MSNTLNPQRGKAIAGYLLMAFAYGLCLARSEGFVVPMALGQIVLTVAAMRRSFFCLAFFGALFTGYLLITSLCGLEVIKVYLLEAIKDREVFFEGFSLLILAHCVFSFPVLFGQPGVAIADLNPVLYDRIDDLVMFAFALLAIGFSFYGFQLYGGLVAFLNTPYDPVFEGASDNSYKHVIIGTAGILNTTVFCYFLMQFSLRARRLLYLAVLAAALCCQTAFFIQGKREYLLELMTSAGLMMAVARAASTGQEIKLARVALFVSGAIGLGVVGLVLRMETGDGSESLILTAIGYEASFTVATFLNRVFAAHYYDLDFDLFKDLVDILVISIPRDLLEALGFDKDSLTLTSNFTEIYVENKGGSFVFSSAYAAFGTFGVLLYAAIVGAILRLFDTAAVKSRIWVYAVCVAYVWVILRKDVILAYKYYFTGLIVVGACIAMLHAAKRVPRERLFEEGSGEAELGEDGVHEPL